MPPTAPKPASAKAPGQPGPGPQLDPFRPLNRRRRLLVLALTVTTVVVGTVLMFRPHQRLMGAKAARANAERLAACPLGAASAAVGCPGGRLPVMVLPVAAPAAPR